MCVLPVKKYIHISSLTRKYIQKGDLILGPWCDHVDFFKNSEKYLIDPSKNKIDLRGSNIYCDKVILEILDKTSIALNSHHGLKYSSAFWNILLSNWITCIVNNLHYYHVQIDRISNTLSEDFIILTDEEFDFFRISDPYQNMHNDKYIHSLISFLVINTKYKNIICKNFSVMKKNFYKNFNTETPFLKRIVWLLLRFSNKKKLFYGIAGLKGSEFYASFFKLKGYQISNKSSISYLKKDLTQREKFKVSNFGNDVFINLVCKFVEQNIPSTVLENFNCLIGQAKDYHNKSIAVATPGMYQDEQLIELALAKEVNNAKIIQVQEAGNGMDKYCASSNFLYGPIDYYLTWGWIQHVKYNGMFKVIPSRLSIFKNMHKVEFDNILYLTKFPIMHAGLYDSTIIKNWRKYYKNRLDFIEYINKTKLSNRLILKLHHGSSKGFNEKMVMDNMGCQVKYFHDEKVSIKNTKILFVDYLSSIFFESMAYNTPVIMCIDPEVNEANSQLQFYIDRFIDVGIIFTDAVEAAKKVNSVYKDVDLFWNSNEIQLLRSDFIEAYVVTSNDWLKDTLSCIDDIDRNTSKIKC